ncbi:MAG: ASKHA domain-containing protein [Gammaproteobacteria bacterium]|nr:ASKHA domain-containing protein [Gammaproteobacteria bacterium]
MTSRINTAIDSNEAPAAEAAQVRVVFTPSGKRGSFAPGTTVLEAARMLGVDIDSVCGGRAICGRCAVKLSEGSFAKHGIDSRADHLSAVTETERTYFQTLGRHADRRLACSASMLDDVVIDVPPDSQVHKQVVRKRIEVHSIEVDPAIRIYFVEVPEPDMHDPAGDLRRLREALEFEWSLTDLEFPAPLLPGFQKILRDGNFAVTVAVADGRRVVALWPGYHDRVYGVAVDIGSTTIAAHLIDLSTGRAAASAGVMNPQIRFGEDLMSRVSYVMMNPGGEVELTRVVRDAICQLVRDACEEAGVVSTSVLELVLVGNPVMHHLFLGINPVELGGAPFALATDEAVRASAAELGLDVNPRAMVYVLPCIAGHVGADTAAVVLSEAPYLRDELTLVVDVGTNAEIVLGNRRKLLAASSPTGPAFEGAQISCGQRAAPGAVERVRIDPVTLEPRFKVIGCDLWSDDAGFAEASAHVGITGVCGSGIIELIAELFLAGVITTDGIIDGSNAARSTRVFPAGKTFSYMLHDGDVRLALTQNDVRAIQLAKAALFAGARLLMDKMRIDRVDRIRPAGAFGAHIDVKYAMVLGMIPDCRLEHVTSAGNAAGTGASIAPVDRKARTEIEAEVRRIEKVETAVEAKFQQHFVEAMAFPHKTIAFTELAKEVTLPAPRADSSGGGTGPRRRRRRR